MANTGEVCKLLGVSNDTLRRWSNDEHFGRFLSPAATPPKGEERNYSEHDLRVLHFVASSRKDHASIEDIRQRLTRMRDSDWAGLPDIPEGWKRATGGEVPVKDVSEIVARTAELATLQAQVSHLREERDHAVERANQMQAKLDDLERSERTTQGELNALRVDLEAERGRVSTLEARLQAYSITGDKPTPIALIIVAALVAGAVLVALALVLARLVLV